MEPGIGTGLTVASVLFAAGRDHEQHRVLRSKVACLSKIHEALHQDRVVVHVACQVNHGGTRCRPVCQSATPAMSLPRGATPRPRNGRCKRMVQPVGVKLHGSNSGVTLFLRDRRRTFGAGKGMVPGATQGLLRDARRQLQDLHVCIVNHESPAQGCRRGRGTTARGTRRVRGGTLADHAYRLGAEHALRHLRARLGSHVSTRILGSRTAPYPPFLIYIRAPHGSTQDPSTHLGRDIFDDGAHNVPREEQQQHRAQLSSPPPSKVCHGGPRFGAAAHSAFLRQAASGQAASAKRQAASGKRASGQAPAGLETQLGALRCGARGNSGLPPSLTTIAPQFQLTWSRSRTKREPVPVVRIHGVRHTITMSCACYEPGSALHLLAEEARLSIAPGNFKVTERLHWLPTFGMRCAG